MELPSFYKTFFAAKASIGRQRQPFAALFISLVFLCSSPDKAQASVANHHVYPLAELKQDTANFLTSYYQHLGSLEVSVGNLDRRLRLNRCNDPVEFTPRDSSGTGGNISVQVKCQTQGGWTLHIPAQVSVFRSIPVAMRDLARGEQISASDIQWETINISLLRQSYLLETKEIIGLEVKRNIGLGSPFLSASLDAPKVIYRGETVDLESSVGGINVSASGTALTDGRLGQKIRVRNNQSDRVVTGTVVASGKVSAR